MSREKIELTDPRVLLTVLVMLLLIAAMIFDVDDLLKGAIIAAFTTVISWWFGSSKGSSDKSQQIEKQLLLPAPEKVQEVEVVNTAADPVPTVARDEDGAWMR